MAGRRSPRRGTLCRTRILALARDTMHAIRERGRSARIGTSSRVSTLYKRASERNQYEGSKRPDRLTLSG